MTFYAFAPEINTSPNLTFFFKCTLSNPVKNNWIYNSFITLFLSFKALPVKGAEGQNYFALVQKKAQ